MACLFNLFTRRKRKPSTPLVTENWRNPSSLYLTWLPQLPPSSSKQIRVDYPTVRDIPSWLLLSPVNIPSAAQANESNNGNQEILRTSPPLPYLSNPCQPSQKAFSIIAADERIEEDIFQALSSPLKKDKNGRVSVMVSEPDQTSTSFEHPFRTESLELVGRDETRESRWTFGSVFAPLDTVARRSIRIHDSIFFGLGNDDDGSTMGMDCATNPKQKCFEVGSVGDELEARQQHRVAMLNFVLTSGEIARAERRH